MFEPQFSYASLLLMVWVTVPCCCSATVIMYQTNLHISLNDKLMHFCMIKVKYNFWVVLYHAIIF